MLLQFTKTECGMPGRFEMMYSHVNHRGSWWSDPLAVNGTGTNAGIHVWFSCTDEGRHSTLSGDIVRVFLVDDDGHRGTFDWAMSSAKSGGFVTDEWVHMSLAVNRGSKSAVHVYVDGRPLDSISDTLQGTNLRDLRRAPINLNDMQEVRTEEETVEMCAAHCRSSGYQYMGLQYRDECRCDNSYGSFGEATADAPDGQGTCDIDNDGHMDCGYNVARNESACDPLDGYCIPNACGWRNAVFDLSDQEPTSVGCYIDGRTPATCEDADTCEACALLVGLHCGWSNRRGGSCQEGGRTTSDECSVSEYGFPLNTEDNPNGFWSWSETSDNALWPDPTAPNVTFAGFTLDEVYEVRSDYYYNMTLPAGPTLIIAQAGLCTPPLVSPDPPPPPSHATHNVPLR